MRCIVITTLIALTLAACGGDSVNLHRVEPEQEAPETEGNDGWAWYPPSDQFAPEQETDPDEQECPDVCAPLCAGNDVTIPAGCPLPDECPCLEYEDEPLANGFPSLACNAPSMETLDLGPGYPAVIGTDEEGIVTVHSKLVDGETLNVLQSFTSDLEPRIEAFNVDGYVQGVHANGAGFLVDLDSSLLQLDDEGNPLFTAPLDLSITGTTGGRFLRKGNEVSSGEIEYDLSLVNEEAILPGLETGSYENAEQRPGFSDSEDLIFLNREWWDSDYETDTIHEMAVAIRDASDSWTEVTILHFPQDDIELDGLRFIRGYKLDDGSFVVYHKRMFIAHSATSQLTMISSDGVVTYVRILDESIVDMVTDGDRSLRLRSEWSENPKVILEILFQDSAQEIEISGGEAFPYSRRMYTDGESVYVSWSGRPGADLDTRHSYLTKVSCE